MALFLRGQTTSVSFSPWWVNKRATKHKGTEIYWLNGVGYDLPCTDLSFYLVNNLLLIPSVEGKADAQLEKWMSHTAQVGGI